MRCRWHEPRRLMSFFFTFGSVPVLTEPLMTTKSISPRGSLTDGFLGFPPYELPDANGTPHTPGARDYTQEWEIKYLSSPKYTLLGCPTFVIWPPNLN